MLSTRAVINHAISHGVSKSLQTHSMEFKPPATVSFNNGNTAEIWEQQCRIYFEAAELATKPPKTQVAILLHCAGTEAQDIFTNFVFANTVDDKDWEYVLKKFKTYCEPRKNEVFERYKFWQRDQRQEHRENIDQWVNDLRILLSTCEYGQQKESSLRDRIVFGVADIRVKERLLRESDLTLEKALYICHIAEGIIFVGERVLIPGTLRQQMLRLIHESHMGAEKCKARARTVMYWPGMSKDIEHEVFKCSVCKKHQKSQQRNPMIPHDIPDGRWQKLAMDIMTYHGRDFQVVVDYYSKYPEISQLPDKTADTIITHTKSICSRHGIAEEIVSDNMPFGSREFNDFAQEWGIKTTTSSPTYAQSNGQAERFVQTLKGLLKKADEEGRDPYIALLEYRNTPISALQYTPSQMLMISLLRSKLPTKQSLLQPKVVQAHDDLTRRQQRQKLYYENVHRLCRSLVLAMLSAFREERCGSRQSSEALTLTLARIWSRVSTDNSDETEGTSAKRTSYLRYTCQL